MAIEKEFIKYKKRGAYHWRQVSDDIKRSNAFVKARYQKCMKLLESEAEDISGKKVLDLGCGDGVLTYMVQKRGARVRGIDLSELAIQFAREQHKKRGSDATFTCCSVYDAGFEDNSFDVIFCSDVIEHVSDPLPLLGEIKRILKPGGKAIISTPIRVTSKPLDEMHVFEWFPEEFEDAVKNVFENSKFFVSHPLFWFEFFSHSQVNRVVTNLISKWRNPFLSDSPNWKYFAMQYAVSEK
ncbi:class I SAM-dependent methyltransferase [Candidatus Omnitrophota bacterium]